MNARRALSAVGLTGTAALLAAAGGASWYYASRITEAPGARPVAPLLRDRVTIRAGSESSLRIQGEDAARPGWWGVVWEGGYARVGPPDTTGPDGAVRPVELLAGTVTPGVAGLLDAYASPEDPRYLGIEVAGVDLEGPLGPLPTWWFPADGPTWMIFVHGRAGARREAFRAVPVAHRLGLPALVTSYRNDPEGPPSPDGRSHLGTTEWEDVVPAVRFAIDHGARDVVLMGFSMGGACVAELVLRSALSDRVRALVLEAPVLDWGPVLRRAAVERGLPSAMLPLLLPPTMALAGARTRINWRGLRQLGDPDAYALPTLLIHGAEDETVPVALADAFAETRADVVTYLRIAGAGHTHGWNVDREGYETGLAAFLERVGAVTA